MSCKYLWWNSLKLTAQRRGHKLNPFVATSISSSAYNIPKVYYSKDRGKDTSSNKGLEVGQDNKVKNSFDNELYKATLINGGSESYNNWATQYDKDATNAGWIGPQSICSVWMNYHKHSLLSDTTPHKVLDIGCGTGFIAKHMTTLLPSLHNNVHIYGGDISPEMLSIAKTKHIYTQLNIVNAKETLPYNENYFDSIISAGLFLPGHCGPETLPNIINSLKSGGYFITTIRIGTYEEQKQEWTQRIKESQCTLIEDNEIRYYANDEYKGIGLVILKS